MAQAISIPITRRSMIRGAAAAAGGATSSVALAASASASDPIFPAIEAAKAAIEREAAVLRQTWQLEDALPRSLRTWNPAMWEPEMPTDCQDHPDWIATQKAILACYEAKGESLEALFETQPSTLAGLAAVLKFVGAPEFRKRGSAR